MSPNTGLISTSQVLAIILDDEPPTIGCTCSDINNIVVSPLPAANVALHRVEMADVPLAIGSGSGAKGSLHSLHLYVHAGDPPTKDKLVQYLEFMMGVEDRAGRLFKQGTAGAVLSRGSEVSFFGYNGGTLKEITLEDLQRIPTA